jgi:hypothetical protein
MASKKPVAVASPSVTNQKTPVTEPPKKPQYWTFSFRYWREIEDFGLLKRPHWYASVFGRLRELGKIPVAQFLGDREGQEARRYHAIDWTAKNIPIQRAEMVWIAKEYLNNPDDYPLVQFHISRAVGRVIGFWDEKNVFNIVLFDPMHNMQPSRATSYQVTPSPPLNCEYTSLLRDVAVVKDRPCRSDECELRAAISALPTYAQLHEVLVIPFAQGTIKDAENLLKQGKAKSMSDIFERGVMELLDDAHPD